MIKIINIMATLLVTVFIMGVPEPMKASAASEDIVRVSWYPQIGYQERDINGNPRGYYFDYLKTIEYYTGLKFEFVDENWNDGYEELKNGSVDIICGMQQTSEREKYFAFSNDSVGIEMSCIYVPENKEYQADDFKSFNGMRIAVAAETFEAEALRGYAKEHGFDYKEVVCWSWEQADEKLKNNEVDAVLSASTELHDGYKAIAQFSAAPVYLAMNKNNKELISRINHGLMQISTFYPDFKNSLYKKNIDYYRGRISTLSSAEKKFIADGNTITMVCGAKWYPFEYYSDATGQFEGISVDIMREIASRTGLKVKFVLDNGYSMSDFRRDTQVLKLTSMSSDPSWADESRVVQTQPFLSARVLRIENREGMQNKTVALLDGGYIYRNVRKFYPDLEIITCEDEEGCLEAVRTGRASCTFLNEYEAAYYLSTSKYLTLKSFSITEFQQEICFGISSDMPPEVLAILSKGINGIKAEKMGGFIAENSVPPVESVWNMMFYTHPEVIIGTLIMAFAVIVVMLVMFFKVRMERIKRIETEEQKQLINEALNAAEHANKSKSTFLSRMSHEIRTPINAVMGISELIRQKLHDNELKQRELMEYVDDITSSAKYLLTLVNDVLDSAKIDSGKIELHPIKMNIKEFVDAVIVLAGPLAEAREIKFVIDNRMASDACIVADAVRLKQIVMNLLSNSFKFTLPGGMVKFSIDEVAKDDGTVILRLIVSDNGIGMDEEFQKRLFEAFVQEYDSNTSQFAGSGLGLNISRELARLMGGDIVCESKKDVGTKFTVTINVEHRMAAGINKDTGASAAILTETDFSNIRVLLCEDHPLNQKITTALLERRKCSIDVAEDGIIGVSMFQNSPVDYYSVIIMDIRMPNLDGLDATRQIRAMERSDAKSVPIIAMSANAYDEDVQKSLEAGMNAHLAKPVDAEKLYQTIAEEVAKKS